MHFLRGSELNGSIRARFRAVCDCDIVASSPAAAIKRILSIYASEDSILSSTASRGLASVLDAKLSLHPLLRKQPERLLLTAPHTHWSPETLIIAVHDPEQNCLFIGANDIQDDWIYAPVSFVFVDQTPVPYEFFCLDGNSIDVEVLDEFFSLLPTVAECLDSAKDGLGFSYDYRSAVFPNDTLRSTVESDFNEDVGIVMTSSCFERMEGSSELEKAISVAWPALTKIRIDALDTEEKGIFAQLSAQISNCNSEEERALMLEQLISFLEE